MMIVFSEVSSSVSSVNLPSLHIKYVTVNTELKAMLV